MEELRALVLRCAGAPAPFEAFQDALDHHCERLPGGAVAEVKDLRLLTTKHKGDLWELFCRQYLVHQYGCSDVWLLKDVPEDLRTQVGLKKNDLGIDLVARKGKRLLAIQCKWRQPQRFKVVPGTKVRTNVVPWKDLSTFLALSDRLGFHERVVMTNAVGVRRVGGRRTGDRSLCLGSFKALTGTDLLTLVEAPGSSLLSSPSAPAPAPLDVQDLRAARLKALGA